ncbi:hypothetical protein ACHAW5_009376 [Stephanodiscus triporus]|uniref:Metallo-beta-lactamase domain-containing protein n=1 Tax=Stephanodiscus triporus TaxID=2934178 RepID=A0ABD3NTT1_9STRA
MTIARASLPLALIVACCRASSGLRMTTSTTSPGDLPLSRKRDMLIEERDLMGPCGSTGSYMSPTWSNRLGCVLTPVSIPGIYTADRPFYWNGIDVGGRMTVIRLLGSSSSSSSSSRSDATRGGGELVVHSPVELDRALIEALSRLGTVAHVISPNYEHVKYARQWAEHYPNARVWGCPGLSDRAPGVGWTGEVPRGARPGGYRPAATKTTTTTSTMTRPVDGMWDWNELMPMHVDAEINPFTGKSFFNEVIFYHVPSRTLLTTDLYWNYPRGDGVTNGQVIDELDNPDCAIEDFGPWELAPSVGRVPPGSILWGKVGMDVLFRPFYNNFMVGGDRRDAFEEIARHVACGGWDVETIIPCHGDIVRGRRLCRMVLERHFGVKCRA